MRSVAFALLLAACTPTATVTETPVTLVTGVNVPSDLRTCPAVPAPPAKPPQPRTVESVLKFADQAELARLETVTALEVCRGKLIRILKMVDGG